MVYKNCTNDLYTTVQIFVKLAWIGISWPPAGKEILHSTPDVNTFRVFWLALWCQLTLPFSVSELINNSDPPISGSGSGTDPSRFWRNHERLCIRSLLSMRGMLLRYSFEPRPKGRVLVTLVLVMTIDQSINGCSYSEEKKTVWRESTRLTSPEVWAAVSVLKGLTRSRGASFSPPNSRRSKRISWGVLCLEVIKKWNREEN